MARTDRERLGKSQDTMGDGRDEDMMPGRVREPLLQDSLLRDAWLETVHGSRPDREGATRESSDSRLACPGLGMAALGHAIHRRRH